MADEDVQAKFNLDVKEAIENALKAKTAIKDMSAAENLSGLVGGLLSVAPLLAGIGVAAYALKKTFDLVFEAEQIKSINLQFDILTRNAGIAGNDLKEAMMKASGGLLTTKEILEETNKSIVILGDNVKRLPEIMELARKVSIVTGKDLKTAFEEVSFAIEVGSQRQLKRLGILVDVNKAETKYAQSLGQSKEALSAFGKQQALVDAALEQGKKNYEGVDGSIKIATKSWTQFKVALEEASEAFVLRFDKIFGPTVQNFFKNFAEWATKYKEAAISAGDGLDAWNAKSTILTNQIEELKNKISAIRKESEGSVFGFLDNSIINDEVNKLRKLEGQLAFVRIQIDDARKASRDSGEGVKREKESPLDTEKLKEIAAKYASQMRDLNKEIASNREKSLLEEAQIEELVNEKKLDIWRAYYAKKAEIETQFGVGTTERKNLEVKLQSSLESELTLVSVEESRLRTDLLKKSFENQEKIATGFFGKFAAGARKASADAKIAFMDFSAIGNSLVNKLGDNIAEAFQGIGEEGFVLGAAMKKAIIGALADEAMARGALLIASSIWPPNPVGLAAGVGLEALSGVLRALAGSGGGAGVSSGGGSASNQPGARNGPNIGIAETSEVRSQAAADAAQAGSRRSVNVTIQGHYFETEQTKTRLVEIIREAGDITDFKTSFIGG